MSSTPAQKTPTSRSQATQARLIAVAERLFAERGIEGVTLIEINQAAGQRNRNACRYHFGDRNGLLQAILDKHVPGITARRNALLDRFDAAVAAGAAGKKALRLAVQAFVQPNAEKLFDADGGKEYVRINAQLVVLQTQSYSNPDAAPLTVQDTSRLTRALRVALGEERFPEAILQQRLLLAAMLLAHSLADHSRMGDALAPGAAADTDIFISNLEDSVIGLLTAPVSTNTQNQLRRFEGAEAPAGRAARKRGPR